MVGTLFVREADTSPVMDDLISIIVANACVMVSYANVLRVLYTCMLFIITSGLAC